MLVVRESYLIIIEKIEKKTMVVSIQLQLSRTTNVSLVYWAAV